MPTANSIEEYLELKSQGHQQITGKLANKELMGFIMKEMRMGEIGLLKSFGIHVGNNRFYYNLDSKFPFGKHKDNLLKHVYKCDPHYVEWCLLNADSFCIDKETIRKLENIRPWRGEDLPFIINAEGKYILDIRSFRKDSNGFPTSSEIREIDFTFPKMAKEKNDEKLNSELNPFTVLRGSNWSKESPLSFSGTKNKIEILF